MESEAHLASKGSIPYVKLHVVSREGCRFNLSTSRAQPCHGYVKAPSSVVKQSQVCKRHSHTICVASRDHLLICHRATGLGDKLHAIPCGKIDGVSEWEESIRRDCYAIQSLQPLIFLPLGKGLWHRIEILFPLCKLSRVHVALYEANARIDTVLALHSGFESQASNLGVEAQSPSFF